MGFLHGVETIEVTDGAKPIRGVKTAVIGLVGTAPIHHVASADQHIDDSVLVLGDVSAKKSFGPVVTGYTIPQALRDIFAQGAGLVIVINTFDPATHKTTVAAADLDITDKQIQLANADVISATVKASGGAGAAKVEGTDYTIDRVAGLITILSTGSLSAATAANVTYTYGNPSAVTASDVIGTVDIGGARTGMQGFLDAMTRFGFFPKILIAPGYSTQATVVSALQVIVQASKCRAIGLVDAPVGTTVQAAIEGRGSAGEINFNVSDDRIVPLFPHVKVGTVLAPLSPVMAGVIARTDQEKGFWVSPSNKKILGIDGLEIPVSAGINDPDSEANLLNEVGIVTVFNAFGTGYRIWGNRSSAFPASSASMSFIQSRRTADQVHESLELAMLDYLDDAGSTAFVEAVLAAGNAYMRTLIGRRAVPAGSYVGFNPEKNPADEVAAGHFRFDVVFVPTPPAERITFESFIDINLLGG